MAETKNKVVASDASASLEKRVAAAVYCVESGIDPYGSQVLALLGEIDSIARADLRNLVAEAAEHVFLTEGGARTRMIDVVANCVAKADLFSDRALGALARTLMSMDPARAPSLALSLLEMGQRKDLRLILLGHFPAVAAAIDFETGSDGAPLAKRFREIAAKYLDPDVYFIGYASAVAHSALVALLSLRTQDGLEQFCGFARDLSNGAKRSLASKVAEARSEALRHRSPTPLQNAYWQTAFERLG